MRMGRQGHTRRWGGFAFSAGTLAVSISAARAATPLSYLVAYGEKTNHVVPLTWGVLVISTVVVAIVTLLVTVGAWRRRASAAEAIAAVPIERSAGGLRWVTFGVVISSAVLLFSLVWTVIVLAKINGPASPPALTIEITGEQWWWKARYLNDDPSQVITTANEIHIPVGVPIRLKLLGDDVIHSFWVPALTGKMQTIPGQVNLTWMQANKQGVYRGQCTQYCGEQHAHMAFLVVADSPQDFERWRREQVTSAAPIKATAILRGEHSFTFHCGACHSVRGTAAGGTVAPDLTHLMSRMTLAAGALPNTPGNLAGWIANPQQVKPGTRMPNLYLSGPELSDVTSYLETLK